MVTAVLSQCGGTLAGRVASKSSSARVAVGTRVDARAGSAPGWRPLVVASAHAVWIVARHSHSPTVAIA